MTEISDEKPDDKTKIKQDWKPDSGIAENALFKPDELDIYVNKVTLETFIFHGKDIVYDHMKHLEYDPIKFTVDVVYQDGYHVDLGVKIQWLVRPYFKKADEIQIVQTKDGESIRGTSLPLIHKDRSK